ncbi:unnamed protein product [Vicia faba]|uniref:Uncharacterized protein n=1 Tax=Vicia faba TaxID=3906 RepID=A0AAV0YTH5_VICFA|nr:unnamed protein product [Vicia faba]
MTCIINNDSVYDNDFQWKLYDHSNKFVFLGGTTLKIVDVQNIPPKKYYFKDFGDVLGSKYELNRLEEIIGIVHEINNFQCNTPGKKTFVSLNLKDLRNNGAIFIIITHSMIKESRVSNGWSGSKLLINEEIL